MKYILCDITNFIIIIMAHIQRVRWKEKKNHGKYNNLLFYKGAGDHYAPV